MGDASQANRFSATPELLDTALGADDLELDDEIEFSNERITVIYSHDAQTSVLSGSSTTDVVCSSFEQLLLLLEDDRVETILFDSTISSHERNYITGWARIFRPSLSAHKLPMEKMAN